jgi:hypothetical protein
MAQDNRKGAFSRLLKLKFNFLLLRILYYTPTTKCGGLKWIRFVASVGPTVGRSVRLHVRVRSYTNWRIFFKLGSNVHLNKGMCRTHVAHVSAQGQRHKVTIEGQISNTIKY